ncbi:MAG: uridylate kinase [Kiloniellales bacterium]
MSRHALTRRGPRGVNWVVKLGGSLAGSNALKDWLDALQTGAGHVVLVPGGGPFADQVRAAQHEMGFDDRVAHHLALLAMEQFGRSLAGLVPALVPAASRQAIRQALRAGKLPVWMPTRMALGRPEIPESWDVTSDSLALWLAGQIGARDLVLVKSAPLPAETTPGDPLDAADLARRGLVDAAFPAFLARARCRVWYAGPDDRARLAAALMGQGQPGAPIRQKRGQTPFS